MLATGTRVGTYEVICLLGSGGMGEVYRALDPRLKRDVALKVLPPSFAADAVRLARFRREAEVLTTLDHPNIAAIYGIEEAGDVIALVLQVVDNCRRRRAAASTRHTSRGNPNQIPQPEGLTVKTRYAGNDFARRQVARISGVGSGQRQPDVHPFVELARSEAVTRFGRDYRTVAAAVLVV